MTSDRLIPWYFVAFFVLLTIILTAMAIIAFRAQTGFVTKHPYEQGLAYNKIIEAAEIQNSLGWNGYIDFKQESTQSGKIVFSLKDNSGKAVVADSVSVNMIRPAKEGMDFQLNMEKDVLGVFSAEVKFPAKGLWEIRVYVVSNKDTYQIAKRVVLE